MENKYKLFSENHNKVLDLIEKVNPKLANKFEKIMDVMPKQVLNKMENNKNFSCEGSDFKADMEMYSEMLEFQYIRYGKYFNATISVYPFYEDELLDEEDDEYEEIKIDPEISEDEDGEFFIFALTLTNTEDEAKIRINFDENNGKYEFKGVQTSGFEMDYEVFIKKIDGDFYLVRKQRFNGIEISRKQVPISFEELKAYAAEDLDFEEDYENLEDELDRLDLDELTNGEFFDDYDEEDGLIEFD